MVEDSLLVTMGAITQLSTGGFSIQILIGDHENLHWNKPLL